ncbi:MAG: hypothetical protein MUC83_05445 [Pirellula sp.]|nr:hypothetical protein [Pirellula sp.]
MNRNPKADRTNQKRYGLGPGLASVLLIFLTASTGCVSLLSNVLYVIKGKDTPAEFDELKDKKVAVLVSNNGVHTWDAVSVVLAKHINLHLGTKVKKIKLIGQDMVEGVCQDQPLGQMDMEQVASRLGADYIIDASIADLKLREGQTLFRGRCTSAVVVYKKGETVPVFRKSFPEYIYPSTGAPVTEMEEAAFQSAYLTLVAGRIARVFYPYDPTEDVAMDAAITSAFNY